jgi:hypothetical protein
MFQGGEVMYWPSDHLNETTILRQKARLHHSALMLQATAAALKETDEPPRLLTMPLNETFVQVNIRHETHFTFN